MSGRRCPAEADGRQWRLGAGVGAGIGAEFGLWVSAPGANGGKDGEEGPGSAQPLTNRAVAVGGQQP